MERLFEKSNFHNALLNFDKGHRNTGSYKYQRVVANETRAAQQETTHAARFPSRVSSSQGLSKRHLRNPDIQHSHFILPHKSFYISHRSVSSSRQRSPQPIRVRCSSSDVAHPEGYHPLGLLERIKARFDAFRIKVKGLKMDMTLMGVLFFMMSFVNTFLDSTKDTLVITLSGGGVEALPFLLPYGVLPSSFIFVLAFTFLSMHLTRQALFNLIVISFAAFFTLFAFVLFPNYQVLHSYGFADWMATVLPPGLSGLVAMMRTWTFTLFYIVSELWGDVVLALLFWGFANERTTVENAHFMYPLFGIGANLAQALAGQLMRYLNHSPQLHMSYSTTVTYFMMLCIAICGLIIVLHQYICTQDSAKAEAARLQAQIRKRQLSEVVTTSQGSFKRVKKQVEKQKPSLREAVGVLAASPQIKFLAIMAICQGMTTNLLEVAWKGYLKVLHPGATAYSSYLASVATYTGIATIAMMTFSPLLFMHYGWLRAASVTPQFLRLGGSLFLIGCVMYSRFPLIATPLLGGLVAVGALCVICSRAAKFSLFKPAEEMVYIELDEESRTKGKAVVDVMGAQLGKAITSFLQQGILLLFGGSLLSAMPVLTVVFIFVLFQWLSSVQNLAKYHVPNEDEEDYTLTQADLSCPLPNELELLQSYDYI